MLEAGVPFPHNCQSGNCGACKCELIEGDILELPYSEYALSAEERAQNLILACRTQVWGDCTVRLLEAEDTVLHPSRVMRCRLVGMEELTHDIKLLQLAIEAGGPYTFTAGQHARLKFGPGIPERNYSMANSPTEGTLEFYVRQVPRGQASGYVFTSLHVGAEVTVSGPLGNAYLREQHRGPMLAVAGGSGMAPIKSIVETALQNDPEREVHLYFGVRDERDVYLEPRLRELARRHPNLRVELVLSEPSRPSERRAGLVSAAVLEDIPTFEGFKAYIAGPPPMVEALQRQLEAKGVARRDIHADAFYGEGEDAFNLT
jgi:CDP-4-dehydro-6-deoxyglucose reductase/ferredoxin-NAD(P)+ reductase (naphthalene dioxygenase ferredoxin-specific)